MKDAQQRWYGELIPLRDQAIVDVGANIGELSQFFWEQGAGTSEVLSIEPLIENIAAIRERIQRLGAVAWRAVQLAVSDHDGELVIEVAHVSEAGWNASVRRDGHESATTRRVPCRRLSLLAPYATVVKLDVEGHEYAVFNDALVALERVHTWALELHSVPDQPLQHTLRRFVEQGFSLVAAGRRADEPEGPWVSVPIGPDLSWEQIPAVRRRADGTAVRMLHVVARRRQAMP